MAWTDTETTNITIGGTTYYFAPNELIYAGVPRISPNQVVQEAESGKVKVVELDSSVRQMLEFKIDRMANADRTVGALTIRGWTTLATLLKTDFTFRMETGVISPSGNIPASVFTVRLWIDESFAPIVLKHGATYTGSVATKHGDGSQRIVFREEL